MLNIKVPAPDKGLLAASSVAKDITWQKGKESERVGTCTSERGPTHSLDNEPTPVITD